ncbi:DUF4116 domain-containing protein [Paraburkholderia fungorum]|jgi:hypothetical protein|uniref:DUF4116 domain-containing protein n=1 Tax=Paraburkholderia fungorum TaxID=134537 RepID=UPI000D084F2B|nr:DUF4116 domain-containing protein [Paraburkholderia fungorum]PRZ45359.1 hypothetical protein BX589_13938 [Paraburkholderia fungorum]
MSTEKEYDPFDAFNGIYPTPEQARMMAERERKELLENEEKARNVLGKKLQAASPEVLNDKAQLIELINSAEHDFTYISGESNDPRDPNYKVSASSFSELDRIPEKFTYDPDVMLAVIKKTDFDHHFLDTELKVNKDFILSAIEHDSKFYDATEGIAQYNKKDFAIAAMKANPMVFHSLTQHKDVPEVVFERLKYEPGYFMEIPATLKANKAFILQFAEHLKQNPIEPWNVCNIYRETDASLQCDRDVLKAMIDIEPFTIQHASARLRNDPEIVELASRNISDDDLEAFTSYLGRDIRNEIGNNDVRKYFKSKALYEKLEQRIYEPGQTKTQEPAQKNKITLRL